MSEEIDLTETLSELEGIRLVADTEPTISVTVQIEKSGDQTLEIPLSSLEVQNRPDTDQDQSGHFTGGSDSGDRTRR